MPKNAKGRGQEKKEEGRSNVGHWAWALLGILVCFLGWAVDVISNPYDSVVRSYSSYVRIDHLINLRFRISTSSNDSCSTSSFYGRHPLDHTFPRCSSTTVCKIFFSKKLPLRVQRLPYVPLPVLQKLPSLKREEKSRRGSPANRNVTSCTTDLR